MNKNMNDDFTYIKHCEDEIKRFEQLISQSTDEEEIKRFEELIKFNRDMIEITKKPRVDSDMYYLPEYRKNGYFNSKEFKEIEAKVDEEIKALGLKKDWEIDVIKQEILKNEYGIHWLPFEKRFMPGTMVFID